MESNSSGILTTQSYLSSQPSDILWRSKTPLTFSKAIWTSGNLDINSVWAGQFRGRSFSSFCEAQEGCRILQEMHENYKVRQGCASSFLGLRGSTSKGRKGTQGCSCLPIHVARKASMEQKMKSWMKSQKKEHGKAESLPNSRQLVRSMSAPSKAQLKHKLESAFSKSWNEPGK